MSLAVRHPEAMATAAGHLNGVRFASTAQNVAAATAMVGLSPAVADEVSGLTATQFTARAGLYRGSERKWPKSRMFTSILGASNTSCAATEAANNTITGMKRGGER